MDDRVLTFGKHGGKKLSEVPGDYLIWLSDLDRHPQGIVRDGVNWSELAHQVLQAKKAEKIAQQAALEASSPDVFTKIEESNDYVVLVRHLTRELVAFIRGGGKIDLTEKALSPLLSKAGYRSWTVQHQYSDLIIWAAKAAIEGERPKWTSNDMRDDIRTYMDESGILHDEQQCPRQRTGWE